MDNLRVKNTQNPFLKKSYRAKIHNTKTVLMAAKISTDSEIV